MTYNDHKLTTAVMAALLLSLSNLSWATDIIRVNKGHARSDLQTQYKMDVVTTALELTKKIYGPYKILTQGPATTVDRAILEIKSGKTINTFFAVTTNKWEENTLPIRVPIRRGILNYRLLAIHKDKADLFKDIKTVEELKKLKVGVRSGWATTKILKKQGFNVVEANSYSGLFYMLSSGRVDYIPRGLNEIYGELERLNEELPGLTVEPNLALHIAAPFYIFISPEDERLAERLNMGLELMVENKQLNKIFDQYYKTNILKAGLKKRYILGIENEDLPEKTPLNRKEFWFENDK